MLKNIVVSSLITISMIGCASSNTSYEFNASGFTDEEIVQLKSAASEWCEKSHGEFCATVVVSAPFEHQSTVTLVDDLGTDVLGNCHSEKSGVVGLARIGGLCGNNVDENTESFEINIKSFRNGDHYSWFGEKNVTWLQKVRSIFLHELGHAFGKEHDPHVGNVMTLGTKSQVEHLTDEDLSK